LAEARNRIVSKFGGMGQGSTIWGNTQWDKGYAAAITAVLADFDNAARIRAEADRLEKGES